MSCFVMDPDSVRAIANTLDTALNFTTYGKDITIISSAVCSSSLRSAFSDCTIGGSYRGELIAAALYSLNVKAYSDRYNETTCEKLPRRVPGHHAPTLYAPPIFCNYMERPQDWHYQLAFLIDCWLYQTDEDATRSDPKYAALAEFSQNLKCEIVSHSPQYSEQPWC